MLVRDTEFQNYRSAALQGCPRRRCRPKGLRYAWPASIAKMLVPGRPKGLRYAWPASIAKMLVPDTEFKITVAQPFRAACGRVQA